LPKETTFCAAIFWIAFGGMLASETSSPYWRADMRYCPHCRRFNEGKPQICHFCGWTWYVRLCPRGHENPYNAQYCGTCGSADLTETSGSQSWLFIALKIGFLIFVGLSVYFILAALFNLLRPPAISQFLTYVVPICFLIIGVHLALSLMLPQSIRKGVWNITKGVMKFVAKTVGWCLMKIWEILK
jgi:hypothetical protein